MGWFWGGEKLIRGVTPLPSCWGQLFLCEHWYSLFPSTPTCGCGNCSWVIQPCPVTICWCHPKSRRICLLASGAQNKGWCNRARCSTSRILKCRLKSCLPFPKVIWSLYNLQRKGFYFPQQFFRDIQVHRMVFRKIILTLRVQTSFPILENCILKMLML